MEAQVLTYMKLPMWRVGLLINFNVDVLKKESADFALNLRVLPCSRVSQEKKVAGELILIIGRQREERKKLVRDVLRSKATRP